VLIASVNAVAVATSCSPARPPTRPRKWLDRVRTAPAQITVVALVLTVIIVIARRLDGRGTPLRGGLPSGHAPSPSRAGWPPRISSRLARFVVSAADLNIGTARGPDRVESGVHSASRLLTVARLGALVTLSVFQLPVSNDLDTNGPSRSRNSVRARIELPRRGRGAHPDGRVSKAVTW